VINIYWQVVEGGGGHVYVPRGWPYFRRGRCGKYKVVVVVVVVVVVAQGSCVFVLLGYDGAFLNCCLAVDVCEVLCGVQYGVRAVR
jgi:hypothetical protein